MTNLEFGKYYHIYNRGINRCNLFYTRENYLHFLRLYKKYIDPIAETYAWVLLKNHFHLLVRIKDQPDIRTDQLPIPVHMQEPDIPMKLKAPHLYFSDLFNAYSQAINKQENRCGGLFQRPFRRIEVDSQRYFKNLIVYIHLNPVHHGFTNDFIDYPWSSYGTILSLKTTKPQRDLVLGWFNSKAEFVDAHHQEFNTNDFKQFMID